MTYVTDGVGRGRLRAAAAFVPSPVFLLIVACFAATGGLAWSAGSDAGRSNQLTVFGFVASGYLITLCLHEYGHALTAWKFGDRAVAVRGYLTLNPLKYFNVVLSIVLPMAYLLLGGIGLPGGAVQINRGAIHGKWRHSMVSAAGPLANVVFALALSVAIARFGGLTGANADTVLQHQDFWAGLSYLAFLQVTMAIINLLPVPGLDGYGIWEPWLPREYNDAAAKVGMFGFFALFLLLWIPPVNHAFFNGVLHITDALGVQRYFIGLGEGLFRFWTAN